MARAATHIARRRGGDHGGWAKAGAAAEAEVTAELE
jgi:hypothetical protein